MRFHQFHCYAALLFAIGLIEVATIVSTYTCINTSTVTYPVWLKWARKIPYKFDAFVPSNNAHDSCLPFIFTFQTPHDVIAITNGEFFGGPGCFVYYPHLLEFEFIPQTYPYYEDVKVALLQAGDNPDLLQQEGPNRDMLLQAYHLMAESLEELDIDCKKECQEFFVREKITSHSYTSEDRSLRLQYSSRRGMKEVEIIFSDNAGLDAIVEFLSESVSSDSET